MNPSIRKFTDLFTSNIWSIDTSHSSKAYAGLVRLIKLIKMTIGTFTKNRMGFQCVALSYFVTLAIVPFCAFMFAISDTLKISDKILNILVNAFPNNGEIVSTLMEKATNILNLASGGGMGVVSALLFLWTILWMMFQVERVFNNVWGIQRIPRKLYKRFGIYLLLLLLSPFIILLFGTGIIYYSNMTKLVGVDLSNLSHISEFLAYIGFYILVVFILSAMYKFIPATRVRYKFCLKSAILAAAVFTIFQYVYLETQMFVARLNAVYGVIAAVPFFLVWLNFSWQIVIYGAELTYSYHYVDRHKISDWEHIDMTAGQNDEDSSNTESR